MAKSRPQTRLNSRLYGVATPLILIGKDRKVLFFNHGSEELTGWDANLVIGSTCEYTTEGDPRTLRGLLGSLCPPPHVFKGQTVQTPAVLPRQTGDPVERSLTHIPLLDHLGEVDSVLVVVGDREEHRALSSANASRRWHADLTAVRSTLQQRYGLSTIIARSEPMLRVIRQVQLAIQGMAPVLMVGEAGTGKEHIARVIHHESLSKIDPTLRAEAFIPLDCAALLAIDLKRTLRRIFRTFEERQETDEDAESPTRWPRTIYLQRVDAIPRDVQELVVETVQATDSEMPFRLIASTPTNLEPLIETEQIREDFYFLISALSISLPPLRNRSEDLELLAQAFLERHNVGADQQFEGFADPVWQEFRSYNWPGNLDELDKVIAEAKNACGQDIVIESEHLPFRFRTGRDAQAIGPDRTPQTVPLEIYLENIEREQIERTLEQTGYNKSQTAELLGLTRTKLYRRMETLGIPDLPP